jgi:hypothetical protein
LQASRHAFLSTIYLSRCISAPAISQEEVSIMEKHKPDDLTIFLPDVESLQKQKKFLK